MAIPEINVTPSEQEYQPIYTDVFAFDSLFSKVLLKEDETNLNADNCIVFENFTASIVDLMFRVSIPQLK
jgi:hypothetical protein